MTSPSALSRICCLPSPMGARRSRTPGERLDRIQEWTPEVERLAQENMARSEAILECQAKIRFYQSKLAHLQAEQREAGLLTALRLNADEVWPTLSKKERFSKKFVLAALECPNPHLPDDLKEPKIDSLPVRLENDRDIFLARLRRDDIEYCYKDSKPISLPKRLNDDKEVVLKLVSIFPSFLEIDGFISERLHDDEDVLLTIIRSRGKAGALQGMMSLSERLRSDPGLMTRCVAKLIFPPFYLHHEMLSDDKDFLLQAVNAGGWARLNLTLAGVSERLRSDRELVEAFCRVNGMNIVSAAPALVDVALCRIAVRETLDVMECFAEWMRRDVLKDEGLFEELLSKINPRTPPTTLATLWKYARLGHQKDVNVAVALATDDTMTAIVVIHGSNHDFWAAILCRKPEYWQRFLPPHLQQVEGLALVAARNLYCSDGDTSMLEEMVSVHPNLLTDRDAVRRLVKSGCLLNENDGVLLDALPTSLQDREFAAELVRIAPSVYDWLSRELKADALVVRQLLANHSSNPFHHLSDLVQQMHPDLIAEAIGGFDHSRLVHTFEAISQELWNDRRLVLAWLSRPGAEKFIKLIQVEDFVEDPVVMLVLVRCVGGPAAFGVVGPRLRDDKAFMLDAVGIDGRAVLEAGPSLEGDYELMLDAFADRPDLPFYFRNKKMKKHEEHITLFASRLRMEMQAHTGFLATLCCLHRRESGLAILSQGQETSSGLMRHVAEYVGLPCGETLQKMWRASMNLAKWGY